MKELKTKLKIGVIFYTSILLVISIGFYKHSLEKQKNILIQDLNRSIELIESLLPSEYHDKILNNENISLKEHELITKQLTLYAHSRGMAYIYTMLNTPKGLAYSTSSVPMKMLKKNDYGIFLESIVSEDDSIYSLKKDILLEKKESFTGEYRDKWGEYSAVVIGKYTPSGKRYLIGAEYDLANYKKIVLQETFKSLLSDFIFLILSFPLIYLILKEFKRVHEEGMKDELTGLYTRKALEVIEKKIFLKRSSQWALFYFDLDGLKKVNDLKGHEAGDYYIKGFSTILKKSFREDDFLLRVGGDEFIALIELFKEENLEEVKGRLVYNSLNEDVLFSMGIETFKTNESRSINEVIRIADHKMYLEKKSKQNKR